MVAAEINPRLWDASTPLVERVALAFDEKGPLTKAVKGFCVREGQREFAVEAARAVEEKTILVAEAGTGTGKTFAYLTPALLAGATCVISTAGKSLQDQLCAKDLPALRDALGVPVKVALLKGRANYVCHFRLELTASEGRLPEQDSDLKLRKIQRFAAVSRTGDRAELPDVPEDDRLWPLVTSTRENCLGKDRCPNYDDCFVKKAREDAMQSQVVVVNHHLYLSSMALKRESDAIDGMLPQAARTVIDAAHQRKGYGKAALAQVIRYIKTKPFWPSGTVLLTCSPENQAAYALYTDFGFCPTGRCDGKEQELCLKLAPARPNTEIKV